MPVKLPARTDWNVVFEDRSRRALPRGELRVAVAIAGRDVADAWRFVYIPEQWQRDMRDRRTIADVVRAAGLALVGGLLLAFAARAIVRWSRGHAPARWTLPVFLMLAGARALGFANEWPARLAGFSTAQPFDLQAALLAIGLLVGATLVPAVVALAAGGIQAWAAPTFARGRILRGSGSALERRLPACWRSRPSRARASNPCGRRTPAPRRSCPQPRCRSPRSPPSSREVRLWR